MTQDQQSLEAENVLKRNKTLIAARAGLTRRQGVASVLIAHYLPAF